VPAFVDLHVYDPSSKSWNDLSASSSGTPPSSRIDFGFTSAGGKLYVHGGWSGGSEYGWQHGKGLNSEMDREYTSYLLEIVLLDCILTDCLDKLGCRYCVLLPKLTAMAIDSLCPLNSGSLQDLHAFDLANMKWTALSDPATGTWPSARNGHGFASTGGKLYVHCGSNGGESGKLIATQMRRETYPTSIC
jgi:hypothetical protein